MELDRHTRPDGVDWYVFGRIFEQLGLRDDAIAAYQRVAKAKPPSFLPSSYDFTQRRLKAVGRAK
jgi:hypothetical protein